MSAGGYCALLEGSTVLGISARTAVLALGSLQSRAPLQAQNVFSHLLWFCCLQGGSWTLPLVSSHVVKPLAVY